MKSRLQEKIERRIQAVKDERVANVLGVIGVVGIGATIYCLLQYDSIVIKFNAVVLTHVIIGVIVGSITYGYKRKKRGKEFNVYLHFIWTAIVYGEICMAAFLFTNRAFTSGIPVSKTYSIIERRPKYRSLPASVLFQIADYEMQWTVPGKSIEDLNAANKIKFSVIEGFCGIDIVQEVSLVYE